MSTTQQEIGNLQKGERYCNMHYIFSEALLSQLVLVYDTCYQLKVPTEHTFAEDDSYDDLPDLEPGNAIEAFVDQGRAKRRKQSRTRSKL
ncbi:hypothetical protein C8R43DRAFT_1136223 [Mycena crocata]|nr:hypothetical protein C8R43DRAFT_1136223 [Mycena crocata]